MGSRLLIVGEQPSGCLGPAGALSGTSGRRLAMLAGVDFDAVLDQERTNLLPLGPWDVDLARAAAEALDGSDRPVPFLLLGRRVAAAFGFPTLAPFAEIRLASGRPATLVPYPSGRCRVWNDPDARLVGRRVLGPLLSGVR